MKKYGMMMGICLYLLCFILTNSVSGAIKNEGLEYSDGLLSLNVHQASLKDLLVIISKKAGLSIYVFNKKDNNPVTANFTDKPLDEALHSLLRGTSYAIVFRANSNGAGVHWITNPNRNGANSGIYSGSAGSGNLPFSGNINTDSNALSLSRPGNRKVPSPLKSDSRNNIINEEKTARSESTDYRIQGYTTVNDNEQIYRSNDESVNIPVLDDEVDQENNNQEILDENEYTNNTEVPSWYYEGISKEEAKLRYRIDMLEKQIESGDADRYYDHWVAIRGEKYIRSPDDLYEEYRNKLENLSIDKL